MAAPKKKPKPRPSTRAPLVPPGPAKRRPPRKPPRRKPPVREPEAKPAVEEPPPVGREPMREPPDGNEGL